MRLLFPEWFLSPSGDGAATGTSIELPSAAPETYQGLAGPETPPEFVQRVYVHGLARASPARISERSTGRLPSDHELTNPAEECVATQCRPPDEGRADHLGPTMH